MKGGFPDVIKLHYGCEPNHDRDQAAAPGPSSLPRPPDRGPQEREVARWNELPPQRDHQHSYPGKGKERGSRMRAYRRTVGGNREITTTIQVKAFRDLIADPHHSRPAWRYRHG